jgi:hypothetical protein
MYQNKLLVKTKYVNVTNKVPIIILKTEYNVSLKQLTTIHNTCYYQHSKRTYVFSTRLGE